MITQQEDTGLYSGNLSEGQNFLFNLVPRASGVSWDLSVRQDGPRPNEVCQHLSQVQGLIKSSPYQLFSSVQSLSRVQLFATPWTAARQASLSITNSRSLLKLMSIESVMPSNHIILCRPLFFPISVFSASGSFQLSQFFTSCGQSIVVSASASVLSMYIQD